MSFLSTHRLHWGAHDALSGNFQLHLDLLMHEEPGLGLPRDAARAWTSAEEPPTQMPGQILHPPLSSDELGP
jgi:hypothetical protein